MHAGAVGFLVLCAINAPEVLSVTNLCPAKLFSFSPVPYLSCINFSSSLVSVSFHSSISQWVGNSDCFWVDLFAPTAV